LHGFAAARCPPLDIEVEQSTQDSNDVSVDHAAAVAESERGHRTRRVWPESGKFEKLLMGSREATRLHKGNSCAMKVSRPGIISKTSPIGDHVDFTGTSQRLEVWKLL
jgi:hypothetical protein